MIKKVYYLSVTRDATGEITLARQVITYHKGKRTGDAWPYHFRTMTPEQAKRVAIALRAAMLRLNIYFRPYQAADGVGWVAEWERS
jgi:hypothetical protein